MVWVQQQNLNGMDSMTAAQKVEHMGKVTEAQHGQDMDVVTAAD